MNVPWGSGPRRGAAFVILSSTRKAVVAMRRIPKTLPHREAAEWGFESRYTREIALLHASEDVVLALLHASEDAVQMLIPLSSISQGGSIERGTYRVLIAIIRGKVSRS